MNTQNMSLEDCLDYQKTTLNILDKQIKILQKAEKQGIFPKISELNNAQAKEFVLTIEKSGELQQLLNNEINKLKNFDVVLAVVGTMKAGKSTAINAIVGREILPNRNRPMTALPTLICHNPTKQIPSISINPIVLNHFLTKLRDKLHLAPKLDIDNNEEDENNANKQMQKLIDFITTGGQFSNYYEGEKNIFDFLYQLNDLVRLSKEIGNIQRERGDRNVLYFPFDDYKNFANLPIIEVAFKIGSDFNTQGRFILLDTAGPNEAGQDELKEALAEQLERSSAVMIVLDYTQLNSDAEKDVKEQIEKIPTVQKSRLFALVNKFDQKNANSDGADATRKHIFNNLLKDKIELDNIYAISAQDAYLAKRLSTHIEQYNNKPVYQDDNWVADFAKKMYGRRPEETYNHLEIENLQQDIQDLLEDSRMTQPMKSVIVNMQRNAPFIAIQSALANAGDLFNRLHNVLNIKGVLAAKENLTSQELDSIKQKIEELKDSSNLLHTQKEQIANKTKEIHRNIQDSAQLSEKVNALYLKTKYELAKLVRADLMDLEKQLANMSDKYSELLSALTPKAGEDTSTVEYIDMVTDEDNLLTFHNEQDFEKFEQQLSLVMQSLTDNLTVTFDEILNESLNTVMKLTEDVNKEAEQLSNLLKSKFDKDGFDLRIEFNPNAKLEKHETKVSIKLTPHKEHHYLFENEEGGLGEVKRRISRLLNDKWDIKVSWGTKQTLERTSCTIEKNQVINNLMDAMHSDFINPYQQQIDKHIQKQAEKHIYQINDFNKKVHEIICEIEQTIIKQRQGISKSQEEKENERKAIKDLKNSHDELDEDWQKLKETFQVGYI